MMAENFGHLHCIGYLAIAVVITSRCDCPGLPNMVRGILRQP